MLSNDHTKIGISPALSVCSARKKGKFSVFPVKTVGPPRFQDDCEDNFILIHTLQTIVFFAILWGNKSNLWSLCSFLKQNQKYRDIA